MTTERSGPLAGLVTMRMIILFGLLRRSGVLAQRRQFDLSEIEWRIMTQVGQFAPLSLNGLAELLLQDRGQLSRAVKAMVERGLLSRERKPGGPEIEIDLTDKGRDVYARMVERVVERDRQLTDGIPESDIAVLWRVIDTMVERADEMMEAERNLG
ncbi:MarR family protein [Altererythrobacter sp. B11]|uniref:MarR family winged helix-turn-helix transcriptional regulator n=1 Tax=Altererythrobacter sp. B11 TaxID=2060312 RepID=UPI000DC6DF13|nr:MarR family transcriptional regulator [Altererythrobacter sp. B11]BBC72551.1 MarR family protein [Altererythrobacter sp. B11]